MGFDPRQSNNEAIDEKRNNERHLQLDQETLKRVDYALEGTIDVDLSSLSPDDKLTLLIERYNRKTKKLRQLEGEDSQRTG
jgi:hypothetical protein